MLLSLHSLTLARTALSLALSCPQHGARARRRAQDAGSPFKSRARARGGGAAGRGVLCFEGEGRGRGRARSSLAACRSFRLTLRGGLEEQRALVRCVGCVSWGWDDGAPEKRDVCLCVAVGAGGDKSGEVGGWRSGSRPSPPFIAPARLSHTQTTPSIPTFTITQSTRPSDPSTPVPATSNRAPRSPKSRGPRNKRAEPPSLPFHPPEPNCRAPTRAFPRQPSLH